MNNFVNLNVNPCKMCMPMGGVTAMKGLKNTMIIMHGSQGCATYIRRHMATHFNEPIDIASSSLTEHGTVYGGADNLKQGIRNIIQQYNPEMIGVLTTCLAETIGENTEGIIREMQAAEDLGGVEIVCVPTAGYEGTEYEGYYKAVHKIVSYFATDITPNGKINIIAPRVNPADIRHLKQLLDAFGLTYNMVPDISQALDMPYAKQYERLCGEGTPLADLRSMAGAAATIEFGVVQGDALSAGKYLKDTFGIPLHTLPIPIGLGNTDKLMAVLSELSGKPVPAELKLARGRLLDAMVDSHKYNGEAKTCLYGDPDMVYAISSLCYENGAFPRVIATGSNSKALTEMLAASVAESSIKPVILNDTDFLTIEKHIAETGANIMIGSSDGRRIEERRDVGLVRIGFPIHDRMGAQREIFIGYYGTCRLLDNITNMVLERKDRRFRKDTYDKYYKGERRKLEEPALTAPAIPPAPIAMAAEAATATISIAEKTATHPCYNHGAHENARMHIPVAPACNIQCNYCTRKFDCPNETRPGVTSQVLNPEEALAKFIEVKQKLPNLKVIGIAGPGDALANFDAVKKSLQLIREADPAITFCLSTNGLMLPFYANELIALGVSHITVTINAVDENIGAKIYKDIRYLGVRYTGVEAARILIANQFAGLKYLTDHGIVCKVNIVMVKGVNEEHIPEVVAKAKKCGAFMTNIMRMIPVEGSAFEKVEPVTEDALDAMRKRCEIDLKQMYHCKQCRADAIGQLGNDISAQFSGCGSCNSKKSPEQEQNLDNAYIASKKIKYAIASKSGIYVDEHFGKVSEFYIYEYDGANVKLLERRAVAPYCTGADACNDGETKIDKIIKTIADCKAVLTLRTGAEPTSKLTAMGIEVVQTYDEIVNAIRVAANEMIRKAR